MPPPTSVPTQTATMAGRRKEGERERAEKEITHAWWAEHTVEEGKKTKRGGQQSWAARPVRRSNSPVCCSAQAMCHLEAAMSGQKEKGEGGKARSENRLPPPPLPDDMRRIEEEKDTAG